VWVHRPDLDGEREVISYILDQEIAREYPFNSYPGIPCANALSYRLRDRDAIPCAHSPEYRFTYRLPVIYDPTADPTEIRQVLASWADEGRYDVLLQIPAQAILQAVVTGNRLRSPTSSTEIRTAANRRTSS